MFSQLFDVVNEAVKLPLDVDFAPPTQRKAIEALVMSKVGKDRLDDRESPPVTRSALGAVDAPLHPIGGGFERCGVFAPKEDNLPRLSSLRRAQTLPT